MIIRSQDKKELHNLDRISMLRVVPSIGKNQKYIVEVNSQHPIGEYTTEDKAIKVLDMITEEYLYCERCKTRGTESGSIPCYVLNMPQDSEV